MRIHLTCPSIDRSKICLQRHGVGLSRQTMANGVALVAEWLKPVVEAMKAEQFANGYVQIGETPIQYLAPGLGKTAQGYLWTSHRPCGDTVYHRHPGIEPHAYLKDVLTRLPTMTNRQIAEITPAAWAKQNGSRDAAERRSA